MSQAISSETLNGYMRDIAKFKMLSLDEEIALARRVQASIAAGTFDENAAARMVNSHLRFAVKIAMGYRAYGLPILDLIGEANVGLTIAAKKFDPEKGFRFSTYAAWWIRGIIKEYVLGQSSLMKIGTTADDKAIFYNLGKAKAHFGIFDQNELSPENAEKIAKLLDVDAEKVVIMDRRLKAQVLSLDTPINEEDPDGATLSGFVRCDSLNPEEAATGHEQTSNRSAMLQAALKKLAPRERRIFTQRYLSDPPVTFKAMSEEYGVSKQRVDQIAVKVFTKVEKSIREQARMASIETSENPVSPRKRRATGKKQENQNRQEQIMTLEMAG